MRVRVLVFLAFAFGLAVNPVAAVADMDSKPTGPVVLTIAGNVTAPNRVASNAFDDAFLDYHERSFAVAAEFDYAMLEGLSQHEVEIDLDGWPAPQTLQGPWLRDVLAAAGAAEGRTVTALALDGFAVELSPEDLDAHDWLVAIKRNGSFLRIGQRGPVWIAYGPKDGAILTSEDEARWPWAVFYVEIE